MMHKKIALFSLLFILGVVNWSIYKKEQHIKNGAVVYLELAPVDPRSLMQGDYMALRFDMAVKIYESLPKTENYQGWQRNAKAEDGSVVVSLDKRRVGIFSHLFTGKMLKENELLLHYRIRNGAVKFASNAFFFEEGSAQKYEKAKYGQFRVNEKGELLLVGMANKKVKLIE